MTSSEVIYNVMFLFKVFTTKSTGKVFHIQVCELMRLQSIYCTLTFTANIQLQMFMAK